MVRLCRALDIAQRTLEHFAIDGFEDRERPENSFRPEKPIAEAAMLLYAASSAIRFPEIAHRIDTVAKLIAPYARSRRTLLNMALHPALIIDFAVPHVLLSKLGYRDCVFDDYMRDCLGSQTQYGHERPVFGSVEQQWIYSLWSGQDLGLKWPADFKNSMFGSSLDLLGGLREDAYAFTHLFMYCTDFGFRLCPLPKPRSVLLAEAVSLLATCLDGEDYDLAAEVLLAWPMSGTAWNAASAFGFRLLAHIEDKAGILPAGTTRPDRLKRLDGNELQKYAYGTAYHTAFVMGLLCAVSLHPEMAPPVKLRGYRVDDLFIDELKNYISCDQGHWQEEFQALKGAERSAVAPLILDIVLSQKSRQRDYQAMADILALADEFGMASSPMCAQSAELLGRLAKLSNLVKV